MKGSNEAASMPAQGSLRLHDRRSSLPAQDLQDDMHKINMKKIHSWQHQVMQNDAQKATMRRIQSWQDRKRSLPIDELQNNMQRINGRSESKIYSERNRSHSSKILYINTKHVLKLLILQHLETILPAILG